MTPEQIVGMIGNIAERPDVKNAQRDQLFQIRALVDAAVREEREACAKLCDTERDQNERRMKELDAVGDTRMGTGCALRMHENEVLAGKIRARGAK